MSSGGLPKSSPDLGTEEALVIAAAVMGVLILFVVLRFGFNIFLDVCILGETDRLRRGIAEFFRKIFPCWHVRTQPGGRADAHQANAEATTIDGEHALEDHGRQIQALPSTQITAEDIQQWKEKHQQQLNSDEEASHTGADFIIICSICLYELRQGEFAFTAKECEHIFHTDCIAQWLGSHRGRDCPNCRTEILTQAEIFHHQEE